MTQRIIISGDRVQVVEESITAEAPLNAISQFLERRLPATFPILPRGTVAAGYDPNNRHGALLVEQTPRTHNISVHIANGDPNSTNADIRRAGQGHNRTANFKLSLPWMYFLYDFDFQMRGDALHSFMIRDVHLFMRPTAISAATDRLWPARLANIYAEGRICWGSTSAENESLAGRINDQVANFFDTTFNTDLGMPAPHTYDSYVAWEQASADNPLCWIEWTDWNSLARTTEVGPRIIGDRPAADVSHAGIDLPPTPERFTFARARQWYLSLPEATRRRWVAAMTSAETEDEAAPEPVDEPQAMPA